MAQSLLKSIIFCPGLTFLSRKVHDKAELSRQWCSRWKGYHPRRVTGALCFYSLIVPPIEAVDTYLTRVERVHGHEVKAFASCSNLLDWRALFQNSRRNRMERGGVSRRLNGAAYPDWHCALWYWVSFLSHQEIITLGLLSHDEPKLGRFENVSLIVGRILNRA